METYWANEAHSATQMDFPLLPSHWGNSGACCENVWGFSPMPAMSLRTMPRGSPRPAAVCEAWHTYTQLRAGLPQPPRLQFMQLGPQLLCTRGDHKRQSTVIIFHSFSSSKCPKYWEDWATDQQRGVLQCDDSGVSCVSFSMVLGHVRASKGTRLVLKDCPGSVWLEWIQRWTVLSCCCFLERISFRRKPGSKGEQRNR